MPRYIFRLSLDHLTFRLPSLQAIADLYEFPLNYVSTDLLRGLLVVDLEKEEHVGRLLERGTLVMSAAELYAEGDSYEVLHEQLRENLPQLEPFRHMRYSVSLDCINHHPTQARSHTVFKSFSYLNFTQGADLKTPEVEFVVYEDYPVVSQHTKQSRFDRDGQFTTVYFARRLGNSTARALVKAHSIKTRTFYGNTSMESEMGFLTAGQTLPAPGKIMYDPFAGTGSLLFAVAHWGAYVLASDIDGRQMRGKRVPPGMLRAAEQYGVRDQFLGLMTYDVTQNPIRRGGWLDAIVTDPPYGVRAGAKRLGKRPKANAKPLLEEPYLLPDGTYSHERADYVPPSRPYELVNLTLDLIHLARYLLVRRGRLVFFLPTVTEDWDEVDVPIVEGMRELKIGEGSVQDFTKWSRRLITMEKTAEDDGPPPAFLDHLEEFEKMPGHHDFNRRYFEKFKSRSKAAGAETSQGGGETAI